MPVTVLVATGDTHVANFVQRGRACIVTDDGQVREVSGDHARALLLAIEAGAGMYISPEGVAGVDVMPVTAPRADLDAARAELLRAQALKATAEARSLAFGRLDTAAEDGAALWAAIRSQAREAGGVAPAFPLDAEQVVSLLGEAIRAVLDETSRPPVQRYGRPVSITERLMLAAGLRLPPQLPAHLRRSGSEPSRQQASEAGGEGYA